MSTQEEASHTTVDAGPESAFITSEQPTHDNVNFMTAGIVSAPLIDDPDDDAILDLTEDAVPSADTTDINIGQEYRTVATDSDSEALEFLREAGLSEEDLQAFGIDLEEIRAQRQLERQAQQDLEYARRVQEELDAESRPAVPSQPTAQPTMTPTVNHHHIIAAPPPPPPPPFSDAVPTMNLPLTTQPTTGFPVDRHFASFSPGMTGPPLPPPPPQSYPHQGSYQPQGPSEPRTASLPRLPPPLQLTTPMPAAEHQEPPIKRIKSEHTPSSVDLVRQQFRSSGISTPPCSTTVVSGSSSSSTSQNRTSNPILVDDDDDDDVIDLTNDPGVGSSPARPIQVDDWPPSRNHHGLASSSSAAAGSSSHGSSSSNPFNVPAFSKFYDFSDEDDDELHYWANDPFADMINQTLNSFNPAFNAPSSYQPFYASSVAASRANFESRYNLPYNRYAAEYARPLNEEQTEQELRQLLESIQYEENTNPEDRIGTPDGLAVNLMEHQKVGLRWMSRQEESVNKGGMLSDDMGLGKTVQAMSIIVSRPCQDATPYARAAVIRRDRRLDSSSERIKVKATLVVCPVSLIAQWEREIIIKTRPSLKVYVHHGPNRTSDETHFMKFDVVITAYTTVTSDLQETEERSGPLSRVKWHRVVLDEAHTIKNRRTRMAEGCCRLEAEYRWCLTATPIQNKIEELFSLIKFLRIRPYCEWKEFATEIDVPMRKGKHKHALKKVQVLLKAISLRRSKKAKIDGKPILNLPERNVHFTHIDFSPDERQFYEHVNANAQARFNKYMEAGTVMKNYSSVLVLLLRLRQACLHPSLTMMDAPNLDSGASEEERTEVVKTMDPQVVERLLQSNDLKDIECPICMDMADQAQIISQCGHILCRECLTNYITTGGDTAEKRCPHCRGPLNRDKVVSVEMFLQIHAPETYQEAVEDITAAAKEEIEDDKGKKPEKAFQTSAKIEKMLEILHETRRTTKNQDKTIVFSQFTSMLDLLECPLKNNEFKFVRFDGTMNVAKRDMALARFFADPNYTVLLVSTKCGSLGLNLTVANRVILMDIWWNPALENQAIDRVHRIGQKKPVDVHRIFINDTVEDRILQLQKKKQAIADGALGEGTGQKLGRLGLQELLLLFRGTDTPDSDNQEDDN